MKNKIILIIVICELIIVGLLIFKYLETKKTSVLGTITPMLHESLVNTSKSLKNFYEYKEAETINQKVNWESSIWPKEFVYKINNDGLNQVEDIDISKDEGVFRILTMGDSFTFGENVATEQNYPSQLNLILNKECSEKFEIINLGMTGYDFQYAVERFNIRGAKYNPDLVLWLIIENDLFRLNEITLSKAPNYQKELEESGEINNYPEEKKQFAGWIKAQQSIKEELGEEKILDMQRGYFMDLAADYLKDLVIFTFPFTSEKYINYLKDLTLTRDNTYFTEDISDIYATDKAVLPDNHPSPLGHELTARSVFNYLKANSLISCN